MLYKFKFIFLVSSIFVIICAFSNIPYTLNTDFVNLMRRPSEYQCVSWFLCCIFLSSWRRLLARVWQWMHEYLICCIRFANKCSGWNLARALCPVFYTEEYLTRFISIMLNVPFFSVNQRLCQPDIPQMPFGLELIGFLCAFQPGSVVMLEGSHIPDFSRECA